MTIEEIAKKFQVSKSTVSRALSGKGRVGDETKQAICEYAAIHDFIPRENLKQKLVQTGNIGVVIPSDAHTTNIPFFQECLLGICEVAALHEYNVVIATGTESNIAGIRNLVEKRKVDGIILTRGMEHDKGVKFLTELSFPVGMTGTCKEDAVIQVDCDNEAAATNLTSMLIGQGYRRFAVILGNSSYRVNKNRFEGFHKAIEKHGLSEEKQVIHTGFENMEFLDNMISEIMTKRVECIICGDDVICTKVMSKLQGEGFRIPMDISIASFYNSTNLDCFSPSITTVHISAREIGNTVGKQMIQFLKGNEYEKKTLLDFELLFRKSTSKSMKGRS